MSKYPRQAGWTEPTTSAEAADFVEATGVAPTIREALAALFEKGWTGTSYQAADALQRPHHSVQPRISEMFACGDVVQLKKEMGPYGTRVWVWASANPQASFL